MGEDVLMRVQRHVPTLRRSEQAVAAVVLEDPTVVVDSPISALAKRAGVSIATVARFCNALGYAGFTEFCRELAVTLSRNDRELAQFGVSDSDIGPDDNARDVVSKIALHDARAVQETAAGIDDAVLDAVVAAIAASSRVDIYGVGSSGLTGLDLQQKLHRIGLVSFHWSDPHLALTSAAVLPAGSVAIAFSHSGRTIETAHALQRAREAHATTVAVTNFPDSPIAALADHVLATATRETRYRSGAMSSRMAQLAIVDFVFVRVTQRRYESAAASLEATYNAVQGHRIEPRD